LLTTQRLVLILAGLRIYVVKIGVDGNTENTEIVKYQDERMHTAG